VGRPGQPGRAGTVHEQRRPGDRPPLRRRDDGDAAGARGGARRLSRRLSLRGSERHLDAHDLRRHRGGCGVGWSARPGRPPHAERPSSSVSRNRPQPGGGAP
jgi:hypothetical protein